MFKVFDLMEGIQNLNNIQSFFNLFSLFIKIFFLLIISAQYRYSKLYKLPKIKWFLIEYFNLFRIRILIFLIKLNLSRFVLIFPYLRDLRGFINRISNNIIFFFPLFKYIIRINNTILIAIIHEFALFYFV
jgi:hypothetical protein